MKLTSTLKNENKRDASTDTRPPAPTTDLREAHGEITETSLPERAKYVPELDCRFILNIGDRLTPKLVNAPTLRQRLKCKVGLHKGHIEVLGGEPAFHCSHCDEIIR
jgi:hypothetical protein